MDSDRHVPRYCRARQQKKPLCKEGKLDLSSVSDLSVVELTAVSQVLVASDVIHKLDLSYCRIGADGVTVLAPGLAASTSLEKIE